MIPQSWLTGRRGQALAAGIGLAGLAVAWLGVAEPLRTWYSDRAALLEQRNALLGHMQALSASLPTLQAAARNTDGARAEAVTVLLGGATDAVAAAALQERVQRMAAAAGVNLTTVETLPAETAGRWRRIPLRISLNAPWPVLTGLMRSIEESPERIFIDDVHLHSQVAATYAATAPIQASMVLYGFRPAGAAGGT